MISMYFISKEEHSLKINQTIYVSRNKHFMEHANLVPFTVTEVTSTHFYAKPHVGLPYKFDIKTMKAKKQSEYDQAYLSEDDYPIKPVKVHEWSNEPLDLDDVFKEEQ